MDTRTQHVYPGVWRDHSRPWWNRYQWALHEEAAQAMTNLIAVALALALSRLPIFIQFFILQYRRRKAKARRLGVHEEISDGIALSAENERSADGLIVSIPAAHVTGEPSSENQGRGYSLFSFDSIEEGLTKAINYIFEGRIEVGMNDAGIRRTFRQIANNASEDTWRFFLALLFPFCLVALFVLEQTLAILSANIISGSKVLSAHPDCGHWNVDFNAYNTSISKVEYEANFQDYKWERSREVRALNYAEKCYGDGDGTENCNIMASRKIDYTVKHNASCPFAGDVCFNGPTSALAMDTGYTHASVAGLNAPGSGFFRRKTVCAPIAMNKTYVRMSFLDSTVTSAYWDYLYGYPNSQYNRSQEPILWSHPLDLTKKGKYQLDVYGSLGLDRPHGFIPVPEFQVENSTVTIFFIRSRGILYLQPRSDPIFPTDLNHTVPIGTTFYTKTWPSATALGCVDSLEQCVPDRTICYNISGQRESFSQRESQKQRDSNLRNPFYPAIAALSYHRSDTYWTNVYLEERGLDAWGKAMRVGISLELDQNQWQVEAQKIFNISLARYQLNIMAIARGERIGGDVKEYNTLELDHFKEGGFRSACQTIKIGGVGWKNIDLCWFVTLLLLSTCLIVGSFELFDVLISVRVWKGICGIAKFFSTALLVPVYQKVASIRWRDILVKISDYFQLAAEKFGHMVVNWTWDLLVKILDRFQSAARPRARRFRAS